MEGRYISGFKTPSHWGSCRSITRLLNEKFKDFIFVDLEDQKSPAPDLKYLAITDHRWLTPSFLQGLKSIRNAQVDWYIFGDFTLKLPLFKKHLEILQHHTLKIIVASDAQKQLVLSIFPEVKDYLFIEPYPIAKEKLVTSPEGGSSWRKKLNLRPHEKLFGYVGRISPQKGIIELLKSFIENENSLNAKLVLAGPLDPHPFWQFSDAVDTSFVPTFKKLLYLAGSRVEWIPWIEPSQLGDFYSALDLFVSPSYFHDEDFGLTASEARALGVKCVLTEWGGYKRFKGDPDVRFVGLELTSMGHKVHGPSLTKALLNFEHAPISHETCAALNSEERKKVLNKPNFLNRNEKFDLELYKRLYQNFI